MSASILLVDDEPTVREVLGGALEAEGYRVARAGSGTEALLRIGEQKFDVIVSDIVMPDFSGLEVLERSRFLNPGAAVILMTGYATLSTAIAALRKGARDYLEKPFPVADLMQRVQRLVRHRASFQNTQHRQHTLDASSGQETLIGESWAISALREQIARCAPTPSNVLITGESGTGKELVARAIHASSPRQGHPFVPVNCGAIPETLLESQLFGHVKGAFTSAIHANPGLFVAANHGTLFLDEISELPFALQVKLLRVLEEQRVWAVGASKPLPVNVRIVASTNLDLVREIEAVRFRPDLFYRLNVVPIVLPPLRERPTDIPLLVDHFIRRLNVKLDRAILGAEPEAIRALMAHEWKGNVRELENVLERAVILGDGDLICLHHLPRSVAAAPGTPPPTTLREAVRLFARQHISDTLVQTQFDKRATARLLGISLASLYRKLHLAPMDGSDPADPPPPSAAGNARRP